MQSNRPEFILPRDDQRSTILGKTGSGKTLAGVWQLSHRSLDTKPWIILDFKRDKLINKLGAKEINGYTLPTRPGLYIIHPFPDDQEAVDNFLWKVWQRGKIGLVFDEGYMVTGLPSFRAILTQGRSKQIPCIILSQRPVWMDRFVWSESEFIQVFWLTNARDRKSAQDFIPKERANINIRLPDYHSLWYDVSRDEVIRLSPVPEEAALIQAFKSRLRKLNRAI